MSNIQWTTKFDNEKQVKRKVAIFQYKDYKIDYVENGSFVNATAMSQAYNKRINNWIHTSPVADLAYYLALKSDAVVPVSAEWEGFQASEKVKIAKKNNYWGYVRIKKGGNSNEFQGTYLHKHLAIQFAQWCNVGFGLWVSEQIEQLLAHGKVELTELDYLGYQQYKQLTLGVPSIESSEDNLSYRIQSWVNLCRDKGNFLNEVVIKDNIDGESYLRRIDFINKNPRNIVIYELKRHKITVDNIVDTIHDKKYLKLCRQYFKKPVRLVMLSPLGITPKAQTLIDEVINFDYQSTQQFCESSYDYGIKHRWQHNIIELRRRCFGELHKPLFSDSFLQRIGEPRSISNKNTNTVNKIPC